MFALNSSCDSPCGSGCDSPCGSGCDSPFSFKIRSCFDNITETSPPPVLFPGEGADTKIFDLSSPAKMRKMNDGNRSPISGPPEAPKKPSKKPAGPIKGLPILPSDFEHKIVGKLGQGSFGKVFQAHFPGDDKTSYAIKVIKLLPGGPSSPNDVRNEAFNYGSPKCIPGFGMSSPDGRTYLGFSPIVEPLDKASITFQNVKEVIEMSCDAIMGAKFSLITDTNPENIGILRAGTSSPILGEDGLPCAGPLVEKDEVVIIDCGDIENPNDCNGKYGALFDEGVMDSEDEQLKYRRFKCDVVSALLRNRLLAEPRNEYDIVREICKSEAYGYTYAAGNRR